MKRAGMRWVVVLLGSALAGCSGAEPVTASDEPVGEAREAQGDHNGMSVAALEHNAVTANRAMLYVLSQFPLATSTLEGTDPGAAGAYHVFDPSTDLGDQLHDSVARESMSYIVGCALGKGQSVSYHNRFGDDVTFAGDMGICGTSAGARSPAGDWSMSAPTTSCLELVSACLMARTNALGRHIYLSLRGQPSAPSLLPAQLPVFALRNLVPTQSIYKENVKAASYAACPAHLTGPARDCGWTPMAVGRCRAGEVVTIGAGANQANCDAPLGSASGNTMLRVCRGLYGCDMATPSAASAYAGILGQNDDTCGGANPSVQFTCPNNGPLITPGEPPRYGYYSVMIAPRDSEDTLSGAETIRADRGEYPATEEEVFTYQEGAFFGSIFLPSELGAGIGTRVMLSGAVSDNLLVFPGAQPPVMFRGMHGCYSDVWSDGAAEQTSRICLTSSGACGINIVGACSSTCAIADGADVAGDGDFHQCLDRGGRSWANPVTTFLNHPADLGVIASPISASSCALAPNDDVPPQ